MSDLPEQLSPQEAYALTAMTLEQIFGDSDVAEGTPVTLDFDLLAGPEARAADLTRALGMFGYQVSEGDGKVTASVSDVPLTLADIWTHEERITTIAVARGYISDGWGFLEP